MKFLYFPVNEFPIKPMFWYMTQKNMTTNKVRAGKFFEDYTYKSTKIEHGEI